MSLGPSIDAVNGFATDRGGFDRIVPSRHGSPVTAHASLPIDAILPALRAALASARQAVVVAPPGAGKTTRLPLALLDEPWVEGRRIVVLEPRRLAARAAAERIAAMLGETVGETIGLKVRFEGGGLGANAESKIVTEGVFVRMVLDDPGLDGVAAVFFDEYHERSLDADFGLALALDVRALRPDLRLLVMSATLDGARVSRLLDGAPVIQSEGRAFPIETRYLGRDPNERIEDAVTRAILRALAEEGGSILAFLPGQGEIVRVAERLAGRALPQGTSVAPLFAAMDRRAQECGRGPLRRRAAQDRARYVHRGDIADDRGRARGDWTAASPVCRATSRRSA